MPNSDGVICACSASPEYRGLLLDLQRGYMRLYKCRNCGANTFEAVE